MFKVDSVKFLLYAFKLLKNEKIANIFDKRFIVIQKENTTVKVSKMSTNYTVVMNFSKNYHFFRATDQT